MNGPEILFYIPILGGLPVTETLVNSWLVMALLVLLSLWLTHGMRKRGISKKQVVVETGVKMLYQLVEDTMGADKLYFAPYIGTLFLFVLFSNLLGLFTLRSPTADLNTTAAFALIHFGLVQVFSIKANGLKNRVKGFVEPVPVVLPLNIVGEFSPRSRWRCVSSAIWRRASWSLRCSTGAHLAVRSGVWRVDIVPNLCCGYPSGVVHLFRPVYRLHAGVYHQHAVHGLC